MRSWITGPGAHLEIFCLKGVLRLWQQICFLCIAIEYQWTTGSYRNGLPL